MWNLKQNDTKESEKRSSLSCIQLFVTPWTVAHQAPLTGGFSRQKSWSGLPCPSPGALPDPGIEPVSLYVSCIGRWILYYYYSATWEILIEQEWLLKANAEPKDEGR